MHFYQRKFFPRKKCCWFADLGQNTCILCTLCSDLVHTLCVGQCRSPQWRRRGPGSGSEPGRTLWRGGGRLAERGAKARDAGGRVAATGTLRLARLGTRGAAGWDAGRSARLESQGARRHRAAPNHARGLTARVPRATDSDGARLTAARLQPWGTDLRLMACVPRGTRRART